MSRHILPSLFLATLATGCSDVASFADRTFDDAWQQSPTTAADILFVVDNSGSMADEQELLSAGFASFVGELEETGTDFHLGVVTTDFQMSDPNRGRLIGTPSVLSATDDYVTLFEERVHVGVGGSGQEQGLGAAAYALSTVMATGPNTGFLRDDANLLVVVVSDEDDCSDGGRSGESQDWSSCYVNTERLLPVANYVTDIQALKADPSYVKFAGIIGPDNATNSCREETMPGHRYAQAAALTAGMISSICQPDWSDTLRELGLTASGIYTSFPLSHRAAPGTLEVFVDGNPVPESDIDGFTYDAEGPSITFHGIWIPERGADVNATYTIEVGA